MTGSKVMKHIGGTTRIKLRNDCVDGESQSDGDFLMVLLCGVAGLCIGGYLLLLDPRPFDSGVLYLIRALHETSSGYFTIS